MDRLEQIMRENKERFLEQEPSAGHLDRFEQKLIQQNRKSKIVRLSMRVSRIAAIGLLAIMSSMWAYNEFIRPNDQAISLGEVSPEYQDIEFFFTNQISSKYQDIQGSEILQGTEYKETLAAELLRMDSIYLQLQIDLGANPNDKQIIQAMIRHYQTKLSVMSDILDQLSRIQEDDKKHTNNQNQYESVKL